jgi:N-methylhydantoinase B
MVAPGYAIPNAERIESLFPVLYVYRKERAETAGAGTWRGGVGIEYMIVPHKGGGDIEAIFFGSAAAHCETKGAAGGFPGSVQRSLILRDADIARQFETGRIPLTSDEVTARVELPQAKDTAKLGGSDAWVCFCDGGGGYGDPLERDPENVRLDVLRGLCTAAEAERLYGVKFAATDNVDQAQTTALRASRRERWMAQGRRLGEPWQPSVAFQGEQLFRYGKILAIRRTKAGPAIGCLHCGSMLCAAIEDPRQRALMVEQELSALSPLNRYGREDEVVIRHYCCPGCARVFSTDVQLKSDDPRMPEMVLSAEYFERAQPSSTEKTAQSAPAT